MKTLWKTRKNLENLEKHKNANTENSPEISKTKKRTSKRKEKTKCPDPMGKPRPLL